jgi:hypothetical protein
MGRLDPPSPPSCPGVLMCGEQHILAVTNIGSTLQCAHSKASRGVRGVGCSLGAVECVGHVLHQAAPMGCVVGGCKSGGWCAAMAKVAGWKLVTPMPLPHSAMGMWCQFQAHCALNGYKQPPGEGEPMGATLH